MSVAADHEVIVVGGGHNGLTCAAYLARAGLDVLVLEARDRVGGCASTVDALDGARVNICNCDHAMVRASGIVEELDLEARGLRYLELEPTHLAVSWNAADKPWLVCHDPERTLQSLAYSHPGEVAGYKRYLEEMTPAAKLVLAATAASPTIPGVMRTLAGVRGRGAAALLKLGRLSVADALRGYFSAEAVLGPVVTTGPAVWGLAPDTPGSGLGALGYAMRHLIPTGRPVGGSGALTDAMAAAVQAAGGEIRTGTRVRRIQCSGDGVRGVQLEDGTELRAEIVIAAGDPRQALVEWLDSPPESARALVKRWSDRPHGQGYESKIDAIVDELPRYTALRGIDTAALGLDQGSDPLSALRPTAIISPSLDATVAAHAAMREGRVADRPLFFAQVPSVLDPSMRLADGGHVLSLEVLFTPYALQGGWAGSREPERWLEAYATLLEPGFLEGVRRFRTVTPPDYERDFSMTAGHAPSFTGGPLAALAGRDRELTRYRTPVDGLFLTGAGTFPGAGVWGASGRNAAAVVLAGREKRTARAA